MPIHSTIFSKTKNICKYNISDFIGRNVEQARKIMEDSDLKIHVADGFDDAARLAVANAEAYVKSASAPSWLL